MTRLALVLAACLTFGCSSETEEQADRGDSSPKNDNPIKAYADRSREMMKKRDELEKQINDAIDQRNARLKKALDN